MNIKGNSERPTPTYLEASFTNRNKPETSAARSSSELRMSPQARPLPCLDGCDIEENYNGFLSKRSDRTHSLQYDNSQHVPMSSQEKLSPFPSDPHSHIADAPHNEPCKMLVVQAEASEGQVTITKKQVQAKTAASTERPAEMPAREDKEEMRSSSLRNHELEAYDSKCDIYRLQMMLSSPFVCHREIVKHFLLESLYNECVHFERFAHLPPHCKSLVAIFLHEVFAFSLPDAVLQSRADSAASYAVLIYNKKTESLNQEQRESYQRYSSLRFYMECYLYRLSRYLCKSGGARQPAEPQQVLRHIFNCLHHNIKVSSSNDLAHREASHASDDQEQQFDVFQAAITKLTTTFSFQEVGSIEETIGDDLRKKIEQVEEKTLKRYYKGILKKFIASKIGSETRSINDIVHSILDGSTSHAHLDLLSNYRRLNRLHLIKATSGISYVRFVF